MKKVLLFLLLIISVEIVTAQIPEKLSYQAVVRDIDGNLISEQTVGMRITILRGSANGWPMYIEKHSPITNSNGLISIEIGDGEVLTGDFSFLNWTNGPYFIKTELDPEGGVSYTISGVSQLLSVPYAMHAKTAELIIDGINEADPVFSESEASNITATDIANLENLSGVNTGDQDLTNFATKTELGDSVVQLRGELPDVSGIALNTQAIQDTASQIRTDMLKEEADPLFSTSIASGITAADTSNWNNKLDDYTETDPKVPVGNQAGQMQYWNGTGWVLLEAGKTGQILAFAEGKPVWVEKDAKIDTVTGQVWKDVTTITGITWMDRNLGSTQIATSHDDSDAFGDLYQWGRAADGHEKRNSNTTTELSVGDIPGHGDFILSESTPYDWRSTQNDNLWQGVDGINNPCPDGYRLPTYAEWNEESLSWSSNDIAGAYGSPLKLTTAGLRSRYDGSVDFTGYQGLYWTSNLANAHAWFFHIKNNNDFIGYPRGLGLSVRCVKD